MAKSTATLLAELAGCLNSMPGVFSTPQWGGRAYKIPRSRTAKLLAFVSTEEGGAIHLSFKLPVKDAARAVEQHGWIQPHSFRTLAPAGWISATVSARRQLPALKGLLQASYLLHGGEPPQEQPRDRGTTPDPVSRRIETVMKDLAADGWEPQSDW